MVELGVVLLVAGAALLVAEAHLPGGVLGVSGAVVLAAGAGLATAGGGLAVALGVAVGALVASGLWLAIAARKTLESHRLRLATGREALTGRCGVVRRWENGNGQVFVDGALWGARPSWPDEEHLTPGDSVVVEGVSGLTLAVR